MENKDLPKYEAPRVISYTDDEILEELGPAQAMSYDRNILLSGSIIGI